MTFKFYVKFANDCSSPDDRVAAIMEASADNMSTPQILSLRGSEAIILAESLQLVDGITSIEATSAVVLA